VSSATRPIGPVPTIATAPAALAVQGFAVLRFTKEEVFRNLDGVLETIVRS